MEPGKPTTGDSSTLVLWLALAGHLRYGCDGHSLPQKAQPVTNNHWLTHSPGEAACGAASSAFYPLVYAGQLCIPAHKAQNFRVTSGLNCDIVIVPPMDKDGCGSALFLHDMIAAWGRDRAPHPYRGG